MDNFGFTEACNDKTVVFLDSSALQFTRPEERVYSGGNNNENLRYLTRLRQLLDENVFVTPGISEELSWFSENCKSFRIPRRYVNILSYISDYASRRVVPLNGQEKEYLAKVSDHFGWYSQFISASDYELIMHALVAANFWGETGILTNDRGLVEIFNTISKEMINSSGEVLGFVPNQIRIYTKYDELNRFSEHGAYIPPTSALV